MGTIIKIIDFLMSLLGFIKGDDKKKAQKDEDRANAAEETIREIDVAEKARNDARDTIAKRPDVLLDPKQPGVRPYNPDAID